MRSKSTPKAKENRNNIQVSFDERWVPLFFLGKEDALECGPYLTVLIYKPIGEQEQYVAIKEAVWLKQAAEMIRCGYKANAIFTFGNRLLCPIAEQFQMNLSELVLADDTFSLMDDMIAYVIREKRDIVLQYNRQGEFGFLKEESDAYALQQHNGILSFSIRELLAQILDRPFKLEKNKLVTVSAAEEALLGSVRNPEWNEVQVKKALAGKGQLWDLITVRRGVESIEAVQEMLHRIKGKYATLETTANNTGSMGFELRIRKRF